MVIINSSVGILLFWDLPLWFFWKIKQVYKKLYCFHHVHVVRHSSCHLWFYKVLFFSSAEHLYTMNQEKLKQLQAQVRIGGKGTARRKKKVVHRTATTDDKKLQSSLKKLSVSHSWAWYFIFCKLIQCRLLVSDFDILWRSPFSRWHK